MSNKQRDSFSFDIKLVEEVKKHPCFFDKKCKQFRVNPIKMVTWETVAYNVGADVEHCRIRWRSIRDRFVKIYSRKIAEGKNPLDPTDWQLLPHLEFLIQAEYVRPAPPKRPSITYDVDISDEQLVGEIKKYKAIYDKNSFEYRNNKMKADAWENISNDLQTNKFACQKRWTSIRNRFDKISYKRRRHLVDKDGKVWHLMPHLEFLKGDGERKSPKKQKIKTENEIEILDMDNNCSTDSMSFNECTYEDPDDNRNDGYLEFPSPSYLPSNETGHQTFVDTEGQQQIFQILESPRSSSDYKRAPANTDDTQERMCNILERMTDITETIFKEDAQSSFMKNIHFLKMVDQKLSQLDTAEQEDAKMFILNYLHKLGRI